MENIKPKTIAYIEDDPVVRAAYQNRLVMQGFHVEIAPDGLLALKLLSTLTPDLIILDLMLPKFDGVEVFKFISSKSHLKTVPVIILSTNSIIDAAQEYVLEQASKRLIKEHCTFSTILAAIEELLPKPALQEKEVFSANPFSAIVPLGGKLAAA